MKIIHKQFTMHIALQHCAMNTRLTDQVYLSMSTSRAIPDSQRGWTTLAEFNSILYKTNDEG